MQYQYGDGNLLESAGGIGLREGDDPVVVRLRASHHALTPPVLDDGVGGLGARPVEPIERPRRKVAIELRAIGGELRLETVEDFLGEAAWICIRLSLQRGQRVVV